MMNGKVRAFNGDMGMAMSVFKDMVGKVRFVFADPPYKITQARYDKEGFDYKAMWEVIQKMLCPYGVVAVTCSLTAAVEIMRVAPAGWYRYDLVWHKTTPTGFLNAKKAPLRNHELILIFSPMPLGKHTYNPLYPYVGDNIGAASVLRELGDKNLLILYTVRDGKYLQDAVDWFRYNHINLYSVNYNPEPVSSSPKLYCDYYIDDRNIGTPLTDKGYVDWNKMLVLLKQKNLL